MKSGEMPPKGRPRPPEKEVRAFVESIGGRIAQGRAVVRRLNRVEYENTIRDLLGIDIELQELLPPDGMANGFDTSGEALHTSSFLLERYLEAADKALAVAIANGPRPPLGQEARTRSRTSTTSRQAPRRSTASRMIRS